MNAHSTIMTFLSTNYGGNPQLYLPNPSGEKKGGFFVDYERQNTQGQTEFYEVKPISYMKGNKGDSQLANYIMRDGDAVKGTEILSEINGVSIPFFLDTDHPNSYLTLTTDEVNHPGMIFYSIDSGKTQKQENLDRALKALGIGLSVLSIFLGCGAVNVNPIPPLQPVPVVP